MGTPTFLLTILLIIEVYSFLAALTMLEEETHRFFHDFAGALAVVLAVLAVLVLLVFAL